MKPHHQDAGGFNLIELVVVVALIAILASLLLSHMIGSEGKAKRVKCVGNLRQISLGVRLYSDDSSDASPSPGTSASPTNFDSLYSGYKKLTESYVGAQHKIFACPADKFYPNHIFTDNDPSTTYLRQSLHDTPYIDFSSYSFNGGDSRSETIGAHTITRPGLGGVKLSSVQHPSRTALVAEASAFNPWSWHEPSPLFRFNDAKNVVSFVDGHVSYIKIYWDDAPHMGPAIFYDPPASYDYQWSPD